MFGSSLRIVKSFLQAGANMASATLDSAAVFRERCTKFGLAPELLRKLIAAGYDTFGKVAFAAGANPMTLTDAAVDDWLRTIEDGQLSKGWCGQRKYKCFPGGLGVGLTSLTGCFFRFSVGIQFLKCEKRLGWRRFMWLHPLLFLSWKASLETVPCPTEFFVLPAVTLKPESWNLQLLKIVQILQLRCSSVSVGFFVLHQDRTPCPIRYLPAVVLKSYP